MASKNPFSLREAFLPGKYRLFHFRLPGPVLTGSQKVQAGLFAPLKKPKSAVFGFLTDR
jgi:hypothetical protein